MLLVIFLDFNGRGDAVQFHVFASHRLNAHFIHLHLFELTLGIVLRLKGLDERVAVPPKVRPDDFVDAVLNEMVRDLEVFFFERLQD